MNQIALALEHYWHLRAQDVPPDKAYAHVERRFGVQVPAAMMERDSQAAVEVVQAVSTDFGTEFANTVWGSSTGPAYGP